MRIHIHRAGEQLGPYTVDEVNRYLGTGQVRPDDLAWYEGADGWMSVTSVPGVTGAAPRSAPPPPPPPASGAPAALSSADISYAGFWKRVAARIVDSLILFAAIIPLGFIVGFGLGRIGGAAAASAGLIGNLLAIAGGWLYFAAQESSAHQATLGKRAVGIVVTDLEGRRLDFGQATGRHFAAIVNYLTLYIGWMMAGWTTRKQGLHDVIAGTLVINRDPGRKSMPTWAIVLIVAGTAGVVLLGIIAAIAIPAYNDYAQRAKVAEALMLAAPAEASVAEYYFSNERLPESLKEVEFTLPAQTLLGGIDLNEGVIVLTFSLPGSVLRGETVGLQPYYEADSKTLQWRCGFAALPAGAKPLGDNNSAAMTTVNRRLLPVSCR